MQARRYMLLLSLVALAACGTEASDPDAHEYPVRVGDQEVQIVVHAGDEPGPTYLVLHDDENTAAQAALQMVDRRGGRMVELTYGGTRNITFQLDGTSYRIDPNRMFTTRGATASLRQHGAFEAAALAHVEALAQAVLKRAAVDSAGIIITAHNNTPEAYSALSYQDGGRYEAEALFTHIGEPMDPDDFFFVTSRALYDQLRAGDFNVVLQDNAAVTDDGSLAVYAAMQGIPYVNVEAQHGHFEVQTRMLDYLLEAIEERER